MELQEEPDSRVLPKVGFFQKVIAKNSLYPTFLIRKLGHCTPPAWEKLKSAKKYYAYH